MHRPNAHDQPTTTEPSLVHSPADGEPEERSGRQHQTATHPVDASHSAETVAVELPTEGRVGTAPAGGTGEDLLDSIANWPATHSALGLLQLVPVRLDRDLSLLSGWMNDPAVDEFWELSGPSAVTEKHLRPQLEGDGRSVPCLGVLSGVPMSYWEIYRADLDPLARYYPMRPHDTGIHLLLGDAADRGRGVGSALLSAVAELVLRQRPDCQRVLAEPDPRNTPSVRAFRRAGFRFRAEVELPAKRAALLVRERAAAEP